jgi:hypothetical protein
VEAGTNLPTPKSGVRLDLKHGQAPEHEGVAGAERGGRRSTDHSCGSVSCLRRWDRLPRGPYGLNMYLVKMDLAGGFADLILKWREKKIQITYTV